MADRRIDQLTEAEDISDEDLFVIWKENISQTRSIAKGTMNLATKQDVITLRKLDWNNAEEITFTQIQTGYTCPADGMIVGYSYANLTSTSEAYINNIVIARSDRTPTSTSFTNIQCQVNAGDIFTVSNVYSPVVHYTFVPFNTVISN